MNQTLDVESAVRERYSAAARATEPSLCCPSPSDPRRLAAIPDEALARDYGCGDPSRHLREGETVLDLGSGAGKICFIASQVVGPRGRVIGVDLNDEMLALARRCAPEVARRVGWANVEFLRGRIQDLALDLDRLDAHLAERPARSAADLARVESEVAELRATCPLVADASVDAVVSSCVLNLVRAEDKRRLFHEIFRVLKPGGRAVIADIVSDEDVPERLQRNPELWSGCVAGALREDRFLEAFEDAGFQGVTLVERQAEPWRTVEGIELRSATVIAYKSGGGTCLDRNQAVVYRGPFREVIDDDGHRIRRGVRTAVCDRTFAILTREPYRGHFEPVPPRVPVPLDEAPPFSCGEGARRDVRETRGAEVRATIAACGPDGGCC